MADRPCAHPADEILGDGIIDVGLEQSQADLAHGNVHIFLGKLTALAKLGENIVESFGQVLKHSTAF